MKIFKNILIIFSLLSLFSHELRANTPQPQPRPHTLLDIQENLKKPVKETIPAKPNTPVEEIIELANPEQDPQVDNTRAPEMILELTVPKQQIEQEKKKVRPKLKPKENREDKKLEPQKEAEPKKERVAPKQEKLQETEKIELSNEAKVYNNPVYISVIKKSLKTVMVDSLENANANLSEVKRYWMNEAKLHPEIKKEIDFFQELNNSFISYLNAMYMLDRMQDPNYYKAKAFYEYSLSEATNVLLEFRKHNAKLTITLEDYIQDIEMELTSVNDIIEPR